MDTGDLTEHKQTQLYPVLKSLSFVVLNIYEVDTSHEHKNFVGRI